MCAYEIYYKDPLMSFICIWYGGRYLSQVYSVPTKSQINLHIHVDLIPDLNHSEVCQFPVSHLD